MIFEASAMLTHSLVESVHFVIIIINETVRFIRGEISGSHQ